MDKAGLEYSVGGFILLGLMCLAYLALHLGDIEVGGGDRYRLEARFTSISGLRDGAFVEVGGVRVGTVRKIDVDPETYEAVVEMWLDPRLRLQSDTIASVRTAGIIGDKFIKLSPGGADDYLPSGGEIVETEASISIEELISKYIFESSGRSSK